MPEIKGKSGDRKNAYIDLEGDTVFIKVKPGMFSGKGATHRIRLEDIVSVETKVGVKPFPDAQWVLISHGAGSVEFFSVNKVPLREIVQTIDETLEAKALKLKEDEVTFKITREAHLALITVNLELIDSLMRLVTQLNGAVNWGNVEDELIQTEAIIKDRTHVPNLSPSSFNPASLRKGVEKRLPYVIKQETHDILSLVAQGATERSRNLTPWFPSDFHSLFIEVSLTLWNHILADLTGVEPSEETNKAQAVVESLHRAVIGYTGEKELVAPSLGDMSMVHATLYRWVEMLLEVPFSPGME